MYTGHRALNSCPKSANTSNPRIQLLFEVLTPYQYDLRCRSDAAKGNADLLSRLSLPGTEGEHSDPCRLTNPEDIAAYLTADGWDT